MDQQQAAPNPFETAGQAVAPAADGPAPNPFETAQAAAPNPFEDGSSTQSAAPVGEMRAAPKGDFRRWLGDLENDVMDGGTRTIIGRGLAALGAKGLGNGVSPEQANAIGSVPLGAIHVAQGASNLMQHPVRGGKQVLQGAAQLATIPASFIAPEAPVEEAATAGADAVAGAAGKVGSAVKSAAQKLYVPSDVKQTYAAGKDLLSQSAEDINRTALPDLHGSVSKVIDDVNAAIGHDSTGAASLSQKMASGGKAYKSAGQQIYKQLDQIAEHTTGQPGEFQRLGQAVQNVKEALADPALLPEAKDALQKQLAAAQGNFDAYLQHAQSLGIDAEKMAAQANKLYSTGLSLEEFGRGVLRQETAAGALRPSPRPLDIPVRNLIAPASPRGHVLANAVGEQGSSDIVGAVDKAAQDIQALRKTKAAAKAAETTIKQTRNRQWKAGRALFGAGALGEAAHIISQNKRPQ